MNSKLNTATSLFAQANAAFRDNDYEQALKLYQAARQGNTELDRLIDFNLKLIKKRTTRPLISDDGTKYALVVHAFHLDTLPDLALYAKNFPKKSQQYVTHPDSFDEDQVSTIKRYFPDAQIVATPNIGQDIGALFHLMEKFDLSKYSFICKIHTKKGNKKPDEWRHSLLKGVLGSKDQVQNTIKHFLNNPDIKLAGAKQLYIHGPSNLWKNSQNIDAIFSDILDGYNYKTNEWGFIAGTCFWISTDVLESIRIQMQRIRLKAAAYVDDGTPAHAVERMFGILPYAQNSKILLNDVLSIGEHQVYRSVFPDDLPRNQVSIVDLLGKLTSLSSVTKVVSKATTQQVPAPAPKLRGSLELVNNRSEIHGWLAAIGDNKPRNAIIRFGTTSEISVLANTFRVDLKKHNINLGNHAFSATVPHACMNGKPYQVYLIDADSNTIITEKTCHWAPPKRNYVDFAGFLKFSMTQPMVNAPFTEEDKRVFAMMENLANRLSRKAVNGKAMPLISVIMPTYNREKIISTAIQSVLDQEYRNFELIVIDDCSSDSTVQLIESYTDSRIRLIRQQQNQGHSAARNKGLEHAKGEIITYLDSDNSWDSRYLGATIGAFLELPKADAIYSGQLLYRGYSSNPFAARYGHFNRALLENNSYIDLNAFSHRHKLLKKIEGFNQALKRYVDYDLILRASEQGTLFSVPVLLSNYYYDKEENTVTNDTKHLSNMEVVRTAMVERTENMLAKLALRKLKKHVTIVIPNWESLEDIKDCIESIYSFDWKGMLSTIVIDNASSSTVVEYLRSASASFGFTLIENSKNYGFTYAVNQGIEYSKTDSDILLLNNDAIIHGGAIQALQDECYRTPEVGMTVPRQILPKRTKTLRTHVPYANENNDCDVNLSAHHQNIASIPLFHDGKALELSYAAFFAVYIHRDVIDEIGPLDAEYGRHYRSDRTYCDLMRNATNRKIHYVPEAFVTHKLQKSTDILRDVKTEASEFELMFKKNQWDTETSSALNFRKALWDFF